MVRSSLFLLAASLVACSASYPSKPAEPSLSLSSLKRECAEGSPSSCDWAGERMRDQKDARGAEAAFTKACTAGEAHACTNLYALANPPDVLPEDSRKAAFALACEKGILEPCELLASHGEKSSSLDDKRRALLAMSNGCLAAQDKASCARLAFAYDSAKLGNAQVFAKRDPTRATSLYATACPMPDEYPQDEHHADAAHADEAQKVRVVACERGAEHYLAGDGVPAAAHAAAYFYRRCGTPACQAKWQELMRDPAVARAEDRRMANEEHNRQLAAQAEQARLAAEQRQAEQERQWREDERRDRMEREARNQQMMQDTFAQAQSYLQQQQAQQQQNWQTAQQIVRDHNAQRAAQHAPPQPPRSGPAPAAAASTSTAAAAAAPAPAATGPSCAEQSERCRAPCRAAMSTCEAGCRSIPQDRNWEKRWTECMNACNAKVLACSKPCAVCTGQGVR